MDPQHLARLDDDGRVRRHRSRPTGALGTASSRGPEMPVLTPGRRLRFARSSSAAGGGTIVLRADGSADLWPLAVADAATDDHSWPLLDVDALHLSGAQADLAAGQPRGPVELTPAAVVAAFAGSGPRHRRPTTRHHRPALYLAAAVLGIAGVGVGVVSAAGDGGPSARADEPVSVAEELGMVQAGPSAVSQDQAADQFRALAASRAEREDAEAAAAQVQLQADQAAAAAAAEAARPKAVLPIQGATISSTFGYRWGTLHAGVDFAAPMGTPEYAAMDGVVIRAGAATGFGLAVYIQHPNGDVTIYGHMEQILVQQGQTVQAGDTIALLGNRGESTGPHLHFEVHLGGLDGQKVDPLPWLRANGVAI